MMSMENMSSKWGIRVTFNKGSGLKVNGIFVILLSLDVFESDSPGRNS